MADNSKKGNVFTKNKFVEKIGTQKLVVAIVIIVLAVLFCAMSPAFRKYSTLVSILGYSYYITLMAIGVTFCLITGGVDLSIGTGMICYGLFGGFLVVKLGLPIGVGILATVLLGVLFGFINGLLVAVLGMPPFIATLGTMMVVRGLGSILTGSMSVTWPAASAPQGWFRSIFRLSVGKMQIPIGFLWIILLVIIATVFLFKTRPGRYIIAIGSNKEATRLSGVKVAKYHVLAYTISGFCTGLAGIAYAATFQALAPGTGAGLELDAIASAIIGGTSMTGGYGTITGTLLGVFIMSLLKTGLPMIGLQANWQQILTGTILIIAVLIDVMKNSKQR